MFDLPYLADWTARQLRQLIVDKSNESENKCRIDFDYLVGQKVLLEVDGGKLCKGQVKYLAPYIIRSVHTSGTIRIQRGSISERVNSRRVTPYFEPIG